MCKCSNYYLNYWDCHCDNIFVIIGVYKILSSVTNNIEYYKINNIKH